MGYHLALKQGSYYPCDYLGTLKAPGLEKIADRSPKKPSVIKRGNLFEWKLEMLVASAAVEVCRERG